MFSFKLRFLLSTFRLDMRVDRKDLPEAASKIIQTTRETTKLKGKLLLPLNEKGKMV